MQRLIRLYIKFEDWEGQHEEHAEVRASDFLTALRIYQLYLPYGARLTYAKEI